MRKRSTEAKAYTWRHVLILIIIEQHNNIVISVIIPLTTVTIHYCECGRNLPSNNQQESVWTKVA